MKNTSHLFIAAIILLASACSGSYTAWQKDVQKNQLHFEKLRYSVTAEGDTNSVIGYLAEAGMYQGYPCAAHWIHFDGRWNVSMLLLSEDYEMGNRMLKKGTWLFPREADWGCVFPENLRIAGYPVKGGGGPNGTRTNFYTDGRLKYFFPYEDIEVDGFKLKSGILNPVSFYPDGSLKMGTLAEDYTLNGQTFPKGKKIHRSQTGEITVNPR